MWKGLIWILKYRMMTVKTSRCRQPRLKYTTTSQNANADRDGHDSSMELGVKIRVQMVIITPRAQIVI